MKPDLYLANEAGKRLYAFGKDLPIVDYHCHLSPKEIYEDKEFDTITDVWLGGDHYKWRLMRAFGIDEAYITGDADKKEKFLKYAACVELAAGSPLYVWSHMELSQYFGIDEPLSKDNAEEIYERANAAIKEQHMSPRKLMKASNVCLAATTDDPIDSLEWHEKIKADSSFDVNVVPSFRTDKALNLMAPGWATYVMELGKTAGISTLTLAGFKAALDRRLAYFVERGCRMSDIGIEAFPRQDKTVEAGEVYQRALRGQSVTFEEYQAFLFEMFVYLASKYKKRGVVQQLHLNAKRNENTSLFKIKGADVGGDGIESSIPVEDVIAFLDACQNTDALPETILYSNNPDCYQAYAVATACFRNVRLGAAWWFNDHKRGIEEVLAVYSEVYHLATFTGMLTDSRSFLSYARHDYFRRIFASFLGNLLEEGSFLSEDAAKEVIRRVYYGNSMKVFQES